MSYRYCSLDFWSETYKPKSVEKGIERLILLRNGKRLKNGR
jgi:hypothetical protein